MSETQREFPRYRSHKTVWALKIGEGIIVRPDGSAELTFTDEGYAPQVVEKAVISRYVPMPGDYLVIYADGYKSISPAKAFEEGYTRDDGAKKHEGLPVAGYKPQNSAAVAAVNVNKAMEEAALRQIDLLASDGDLKVDPRWLAIGRTQLEQAWMAINRAIFKPGRVALPGDGE